MHNSYQDITVYPDTTLGYNLKKLDHPDPKQRAVLLDSNFAVFNYDGIKKEVDLVRLLRPNLGRYVYHTSLNFLASEVNSLNNEKMLAIASEYLEAMCFNNNQYLIFRHFDADHPHLHLLVNRITFDGDVVSDSNNYKRSEAILRKLEGECLFHKGYNIME
ncbi:MAG: relaxase/mobilization nuclease domain-containing protein [Bacteroidota bacterium]